MPRMLRRAPLACSVVALALCAGAEVAPAADPPAIAPPRHAALGLYLRGPDRMVAGTPAALRIQTHVSEAPESSTPLASADVEVTISGRGKRASLWRGRTDGDGLAAARFSCPEWAEGEYQLAVTAVAGGRRVGRVEKVQIAPSASVLLESDKPLYQPGQTIHLRALALRPQDGRTVAGRAITFEVEDPRGNRVLKLDARTSEFGVAAADLPLADDILTGTWKARAEVAGEGVHQGTLALEVARYALPRFQVSLESDRPWYAPGERVRLDVGAKYFFGKPVAGGKLDLQVRIGGAPRVVDRVLHATLDPAGRARLEVDTPRALEADSVPIELEARVTDQAAHAEKKARTITLARLPVTLEAVAEGGVLQPELQNTVWVIAARPDGSAAAGAEVSLGLDEDRVQTAQADAAGVATFTVRPATGWRRARGACGATQAVARVSAPGLAAPLERCVTVDAPGGMLLRTDRSIYRVGAPIEVEVRSAAARGLVYLDLIKDNQTVDTQAVRLRDGVGRVTLPPDDRRFGTLAVHAYAIAPDGQQRHDTRLIYVERPSALKVQLQARGAGAVLHPGEKGRIGIQVVDAASGQPARASVGVVMVDQAVLALRAVRPGAARAYFQLTDEARKASAKLRARPAGRTVEELVDAGAASPLEEEAARVLLAGAAPPWAIGFEHDPWAERAREAEEQTARIGTEVRKWVVGHLAGEKVDGSRARWRWRRDLLDEMAKSGGLPARDRRDPWGRPNKPDEAIQAAGLGAFDEWAPQQASDRLTTIYRALAAARATLARDDRETRPSVRIEGADLERLAASGSLARAALIDPWGQPFRVEERPRAYRVGPLRSRFLVTSLGPDGEAGTRDDLLPVPWTGEVPLAIEAVPRKDWSETYGIGRAYGYGGLGLHGVGAGGGGTGFGTIGLGSIGTIGHGAGFGDAAVRVRSSFPETMLWRPEVVTDAAGRAELDAEMADSITTWRLAAEAVAADGRIGAAAIDVTVMQDFFVDLDLPPALTQHDELSVPVAVHNYLPTQQRVTLTLDAAPWYDLTGERSQSIELPPSQVGVRWFRIAARGVGRQKLLVRAVGPGARDAVERAVEVFPDGHEREVAFEERLAPGRAQTHSLTLPPDAIADASIAELRLYPSPASHVVEGLDALLQQPNGCFEQTSSTTYPNALILDYLRRTRRSTPAVEKRATAYLQAGYQKLLSFEVRGGGFSWFGSAPANKVLTAYGLEEFADMARVYPVDRRVIDRTRDWLISEQRPDGSFAPDAGAIDEGATDHYHDTLRATAYIALALQHGGGRGAQPAVDRARRYVRGHSGGVRDPYTLALAAELEGGGDRGQLDALLDRLWKERREEAHGASFQAQGHTLTFGGGRSAAVETTARAATALLTAESGSRVRVDRAVAFLLAEKDPHGSWYSTQATIRALQALLGADADRPHPRGTVRVRVDGQDAGAIALDPSRDAPESLALPQATARGEHRVEVQFEGSGDLTYQLVGRYWQPGAAPAGDGTLAVAATLDDERVRPGESLTESVKVSASGERAEMPIVTAGIPPGCDVDGEALDRMVARHEVEKVQRTPREVVFYLRALAPHAETVLEVELRPRIPLRAQLPAPTVYEYYRPERKAVGARPRLEVRGG